MDDAERGRVPGLSRRRALALLGVGGVSVPGGIAAFRPTMLVRRPRAEGDPVSVERTIADDAVEYRPASDTVRWSRSTDGTGPYETEPFERWASRKCAAVGADVVLPTIRDRSDGEVTGVATGVSGTLVGTVVTVRVGATYDLDGNVVSEPSVSVEEVIDVTPRTVRATITLDGREHTRPVPVFVEEGDVSED